MGKCCSINCHHSCNHRTLIEQLLLIKMCDDKSAEKLKAYHRLIDVPIPAVFDLSSMLSNDALKNAKKICDKNSLLVFRVHNDDEIEWINKYFKGIFDKQRREHNKYLRSQNNRDDYKKQAIPPIDTGALTLLFLRDFDVMKMVDPIAYHKTPFRLTYCHIGKHFFQTRNIPDDIEEWRNYFKEKCKGHYKTDDPDNIYTNMHNIKEAIQILIDLNDNNSSKDL